MNIEGIRVFIPSRDYAKSKLFYQMLGFEKGLETEQYTEFSNGPAQFILQNFYDESLANNLMMQLSVSDVDDFYQRLKSIGNKEVSFEEPRIEGDRKIFCLWGPAGELWHVTQDSLTTVD